MLQQFLNGFGGNVPGALYSNPGNYGLNGASPQGGGLFQNILNSLIPRQGGPSQAFGGYPQFGGALNSYNNSYNNAQSSSVSDRPIRKQALAPGSAVINSINRPTSAPQQGNNSSFNPLSGFAGQSGFGPTGAFGAGAFGGGAIGGAAGGLSPFTQTGPLFQGGGGLGILQTLISPIVGIVGLVRSMFGFRKMFNLQPVTINPKDTGYYNYQSYLDTQYVEGSFDDPNPYEEDRLGSGGYSIRDVQEF